MKRGIKTIVVLILYLMIFSYSILYSKFNMLSQTQADYMIKPFTDNSWLYLRRDGNQRFLSSEIGSKEVHEDIYVGESKSWSAILSTNQEIWGIYSHLRMSGHSRGIGRDYIAINGSSDGDEKCGWNVTIGDVNGDGIYDIIIGCPYNNSDGKIDCGVVYIFFGYKGFNINRFKTTYVHANVTISGTSSGDLFGWSVSSGGDVNGDGIDDLIIGAPGNDTSKENRVFSECGRAYIFFGRYSWQRTYLADNANVVITGEQAYCRLGYSVAILGDMDGMGGNETGLGAPYFDSEKLDVGKVYIFKNRSAWQYIYNASECDVCWTGEVQNSLFGLSLGNAGDFNKDGYYDCIVGSPNASRAYIYYGSYGLKPQLYEILLTNRSDFCSQKLYRLQVNYIEGEGNSYGKPENANITLLNVASGTSPRLIPNDGIYCNVDGISNFYDFSNSSGDICETVIDDNYFWNIKEAKGTTNNSVTSERSLYGNIVPSPDGYIATWDSDDYYECIEEVNLSEYIVIWFDDFEIDRGWSGYGGPGEWERAPPPRNPSAERGYPDPTTSISGRYIIGNDLTGKGSSPYCYENNVPLSWLTSPKIDCRGYYGVVLSFWAYIGVENNPFDYAYIEVKSSKTNWTRIYRNGPHITDNEWHLMVFNISFAADNDPEVYIRFGIQTDSSSTFCGWNIDDVKILGFAYAKEYNYTILADKKAYKYVGTSPYAGNPDIAGATEFSSAEYAAISSSDNNRVTISKQTKKYGIMQFRFKIDVTQIPRNSIKELVFLFEGYGSNYYTFIFVWDFVSNSWTQLAFGKDAVTSDCGQMVSINANIERYINSTGYIYFETSAWLDAASHTFNGDFVYLRIVYSPPSKGIGHIWLIDLPSSSSVEVFIEARTTSEIFRFYCNFPGDNITLGRYMFDISAQSDTIYYYNFGEFGGGLFRIGVIDSNRSCADNEKDILYIDNIKIRVRIDNPYYDIEFRFSGLNASYTSMKLTVRGYKSGNEPVYVFVWDPSTNSWYNISSTISIGNTLAMYESTYTALYNFIRNGELYIRFLNHRGSAEILDDAWLNLTFVGLNILSSQVTFYVDSGHLTRKENLITPTAVDKVVASWNSKYVLPEIDIRKVVRDESNYYSYTCPFEAGSWRVQLLYYRSEIDRYGIIDKICFEKQSTNSHTIYMQIYLLEVSRTSLSSVFENNYEGKSPVKVFDGYFTFPSQTGWIPIDVENIFIYHNNTNLLIEIRYSNLPADITCYESGELTTYRELTAIGMNSLSGNLYRYIPSLMLDIVRPSNLEIYVTRNGGKNWHKIENNKMFIFPDSDEPPLNLFNYKICLYSQRSDRIDSPILHDIKFTIYVTILTRSPTPLYGFDNSLFGFSVDGVNDINNNGMDDIVIGSPQYSYVLYDFENYSIDSTPPDWEIYRDSGTSARIIAGKYFELTDNTYTGRIIACRKFPAVSDKLTVEFKVNITSQGQFSISLTNDYLFGSSGGPYYATQLYFNPSNMYICWYDGTTIPIQRWAPSTTYSLKIISYVSTQKCDIFINGSLVLRNANFLTNTNNISRIAFSTEGTSNLVRAWIDDVLIPLKPNRGAAYVYFGEDCIHKVSKRYSSQADFTFWQSSLSFRNPNKNVFATNYTPYSFLNLSYSQRIVADNADGITTSWSAVLQKSTTTYVSPKNSYIIEDNSQTDNVMIYTTVTLPARYAVSLWFNLTVVGDFRIDMTERTTAGDLLSEWGVGVIGGRLKWLYREGIWCDCDTKVNILPNRWYWLYIIVDDITNTYDIYLNGEKVENDAQFIQEVNPNRFYLIDTLNTPSGNSGLVSVYMDDIYVVTYSTVGYYESSSIRLDGDIIAVYYKFSKCVPDGTSISFFASRDGGLTWTNITQFENSEYWFSEEPRGNEFRFNITLKGYGHASPAVWNVIIIVKYVVYGCVIYGGSEGDLFGYSVGGGGNIANDTQDPDIIIGAPKIDSIKNGLDCGAIYIFTGRSSWKKSYFCEEAYFIFYGENPGDLFGKCVNGEELSIENSPNFIVTSPFFDNRSGDNCGRCYIFNLVGYSSQEGYVEVTIKLTSESSGFVGLTRITPSDLRLYNSSFYPFYDAFMLSKDRVYIVGKGGVIIYTSQFSSDIPYWTSLESGTKNDLYSIVMLSSYEGVICGDETILYTTDGITWQNSNDTDILEYSWHSLCYDGYRVWCVGNEKNGEGTKIIYSTDKGVSWTVAWSSAYYSLYSIDFYSGFGVAVGKDIIVYTNNGGVSWNIKSSYGDFRGVVTLSQNEAIVVGKNGAILRTNNGGSDWNFMNSPTRQNLIDIDAVSSNEVIVVGENGTILRYDGSSWNRYIITNSTQHLYGIFAYSTNYYCAVGGSSNILKYDGQWKIRRLPTGDRITLTLEVSSSYSGAYATIVYNSSYASNSNIEFKSLGDARCNFGVSLKSSDGVNWQYTYQRKYIYTNEYMGFEINVTTGNLYYENNITAIIIEIYSLNTGEMYYRSVLWNPSPYYHNKHNATFRFLNIDYRSWPKGIYYAIFTAYDMDYANDYQAEFCDQRVVFFVIG